MVESAIVTMELPVLPMSSSLPRSITVPEDPSLLELSQTPVTNIICQNDFFVTKSIKRVCTSSNQQRSTLQ